MAKNGLLIQLDWCTGCHACEVACKQEHNYPTGVCGIKVNEVVNAGQDKVFVDFTPFTTRFCDLCAERTKHGEEPACVKHCQATCIFYGKVSDLAKEQEKQARTAIYSPK